MATAIRMPDFGTTVEQVKLIRWLKDIGATVKRGDLLCEVETDKAVSELESVATGILLKHVVLEGADVEQGTIIAYVGAPGERLPMTDQAAPVVAPKQAAIAPPRAAIPPPAAVVPSASPSGSAQAAPMIRNLAKSLGVDLQRVTGTGPGGRILREDVHKAKQLKERMEKS